MQTLFDLDPFTVPARDPATRPRSREARQTTAEIATLPPAVAAVIGTVVHSSYGTGGLVVAVTGPYEVAGCARLCMSLPCEGPHPQSYPVEGYTTVYADPRDGRDCWINDLVPDPDGAGWRKAGCGRSDYVTFHTSGAAEECEALPEGIPA